MSDAAPGWDLGRLRREVASPLAASSPAPLSSLGKYRLVREIAQGAMGIVYEAEDTELRRRVAVKLLRDLAGLSEVIRLRFQREAQAAAKLSHPNVVKVFDAGEDQGRTYLVMELVDGRSLRDVLADRKHELQPMLRLLEKTARGVAAAHESGIVHRDVKPANILVTKEGEPKVGDFGLAHWLDSDTVLTKTGTPVGTPMYMAPEQIHGGGRLITPATDVYALGAILYELLTGRPPHTGDNTAEIYAKILHHEPLSPKLLNSRVHLELETICLKSLDSDPARRYPTAKEFGDDLRRFLDGETILARPPGAMTVGVKWAKRHRAASGMIIVGLLGVAAVAGQLFHRSASDRAAVEWLLGEGRAARRKGDEARATLELLRNRERELAASIAADAGDETRRPLWELQRAIERADGDATSADSAALRAFTAALGIGSLEAETKRELAEFHFAAFERADREDDFRKVEESAKWILDLDPSFAPRLVREGSLKIDTSPSGAEVDLLRYEEGSDRRLVETPVRSLGTGPVPETRLPAGSYLLKIRREGYRELRYPIRIDRGTRHEAVVKLRGEAEIGPDFVLVPAGSFLRGERRPMGLVPERSAATLGDFYIMRDEVTFADYVEFLNHLIGRVGADRARAHLPRNNEKGGFYWDLPSGAGSTRLTPKLVAEWPVFGISWNDAVAYGRWKTEMAQASGEQAVYRLPSNDEWEKAARGVDGRRYPWGDRFDPSFAVSADLGQIKLGPLPVGSQAKDLSPYGARDMAGNISEWCEDALDAGGRSRSIRGGGWGIAAPEAFLVAARGWALASNVSASRGFRLVKIPRSDH